MHDIHSKSIPRDRKWQYLRIGNCDKMRSTLKGSRQPSSLRQSHTHTQLQCKSCVMSSIYFVTLYLPGLSSLPLSQVAEASDDFPAVHCCPGRYLGTLTAQLCLTKLSNDYSLITSCAFTVQSTLACSYSGRPCSFLWQMSRTAMMIIFLDPPG